MEIFGERSVGIITRSGMVITEPVSKLQRKRALKICSCVSCFPPGSEVGRSREESGKWYAAVRRGRVLPGFCRCGEAQTLTRFQEGEKGESKLVFDC